MALTKILSMDDQGLAARGAKVAEGLMKTESLGFSQGHLEQKVEVLGGVVLA